MICTAAMTKLLRSISNTKEFGVPFVYHHIVHLIVRYYSHSSVVSSEQLGIDAASWCSCYLMLLSMSNIFVDPDAELCYWTLIVYPVVCFVMLGSFSLPRHLIRVSPPLNPPYFEQL